MCNLTMVIKLEIWYPYDVNIPMIIGGLLRAGTEHEEHIQIIISSAQEADISILTCGPVYTIIGQIN